MAPEVAPVNVFKSTIGFTVRTAPHTLAHNGSGAARCVLAPKYQEKRMLRRLLFLALALVAVLPAQDPPARAGRLSFISGPVSLQPAGVTDWAPATINRPLTTGDQLFADKGARAEVHVPGAAFRLGDRTAFQFLNLDDQHAQVRLSEGALDVRVRRLEGNIEIDTPNMALTISRPGEYRLDANPDTMQTYVTVRDGEGHVTGPGGAFAVHMGEQAAIFGKDQAARYKVYQAPGYDSFDKWVISRNRHEDRYAQSRHVSPDVVGYQDLDEYGSWRAAPGYGEVWVPSVTQAGWAPYQYGSWAWVEPWGWTWVDEEPWGFAPFHYGRWAYIDGFWGWCPGPIAVAPVYAPALVAWVGFGGGFGVSIGFGGGFGVGWFPLGPSDVFIPGYAASRAYVTRINVTNTAVINNGYVANVYDQYARTGSVPVQTYMNRTVPGAVMAVPQNALTGARPVQQAAVKVQPNQIRAIKTAMPAPRVAPQIASVLGHPVSGSGAAHPPAAVIDRPVVARETPPAPRPSFQQQQALLAKNPGRPLPAAQLQQIARSAPEARPNVSVVAQARPVSPLVANATAPRNLPAGTENAPRPGPSTATAPRRTPAPARAQNGSSRVPAVRPAPSHSQPRIPAKQNRPYEPPSAQHRLARSTARPQTHAHAAQKPARASNSRPTHTQASQKRTYSASARAARPQPTHTASRSKTHKHASQKRIYTARASNPQNPAPTHARASLPREQLHAQARPAPPLGRVQAPQHTQPPPTREPAERRALRGPDHH